MKEESLRRFRLESRFLIPDAHPESRWIPSIIIRETWIALAVSALRGSEFRAVRASMNIQGTPRASRFVNHWRDLVKPDNSASPSSV
jgi:hypothetical protein